METKVCLGTTSTTKYKWYQKEYKLDGVDPIDNILSADFTTLSERKKKEKIIYIYIIVKRDM